MNTASQSPTAASLHVQADGKMLVHCLWFRDARTSLAERRSRFERERDALGLASYELIETRKMRLANQILRRFRGTAAPPDAVEIIHLHPGAPHVGERLEHWSRTARCTLDSLDPERSFFLSGTPLRRLQSAHKAFRVLWMGRGLPHLSEDEFASHYLQIHGSLVAGHAQLMGLYGYTQLRATIDDERAHLLGAGLGRASPSVFAELILGRPPNIRKDMAARRRATSEIAADERRHIDFSRSIMLLV